MSDTFKELGKMPLALGGIAPGLADLLESQAKITAALLERVEHLEAKVNMHNLKINNHNASLSGKHGLCATVRKMQEKLECIPEKP